jgi:hypothetical protein
MMKYLLPLLFVCLAFIPARSQEIILSPEIPLRNDIAYEIFGAFKDRIILFRDQISRYEVLGFDPQLRMSWSKTLQFDKKNPKVIGSTFSKNDFTLFYYTREQNSTLLKAAKFDPGANMIDSLTIKNFGYIFFTPDFDVILSEDRSKALIFYFERSTILHAFVFDTNTYQLLWEKMISPDGFSYYEDFLQILVDNQGNMHLIIEKNKNPGKNEGFQYQITSFFGAANQLTLYSIPMEGKQTFDVRFTFDNLNHKLVAAGLYAEKINDKSAGYFMLSINPETVDEYARHFEPFDETFITTLLGKDAEKNRGFAEININELVLRRDGGVLLIAERTKEYERRLGAPSRVNFDGMGRFIVDYYFDDILAISIHPDGQTHWKVVMPKKQYSQDDGGIYSSFFLFKTAGKLRFLYNDEIKYENTASQYLLSGNGLFERFSLLNTEKLDLRLRFRDALQISGDALIVPSERRNKIRLVKVRF